MSGTAELSLVVSTIGRPVALGRLLDSLAATTDPQLLEVVLVDQSDDRSCTAVAEGTRWPFAIRVTTSERGASVGRNAGLALASAGIVGFPDDDAFYPPATPSRVLATMLGEPGLAALSGQQQTADGRPSMLRWRRRPTTIRRTNVLHTSIMSTMFFRRSWLDRVGGFDERMGVGAPGWYHAGEESDLVLRVVDAGGRAAYDPSIVVWQDEPRDEPTEAFVRKMLEYGCGQGHLWRKLDLPRWLFAWYVARKVVGAAVRALRGRRILARADLAWSRGSVAGLRDVCPPELRELATVPATARARR